MGAIQATVFDIHDTKSTPHSLLSSPRLLVSIYARTLEIDIWISMSHALLRESSPLSKRTDGEAVSTRPRAARPLVASRLAVNFRWNENCWQHTRIPWKRIFVVRPRDRTGESVFYPSGTTVLIVLNAHRPPLVSKTLLDLPWFSSSREILSCFEIFRSIPTTITITIIIIRC